MRVQHVLEELATFFDVAFTQRLHSYSHYICDNLDDPVRYGHQWPEEACKRTAAFLHELGMGTGFCEFADAYDFVIAERPTLKTQRARIDWLLFAAMLAEDWPGLDD
jgi:hypothetical protein